MHPVNGECYYGFYNTGIIWRGDIGSVTAAQAFKLPNSSIRIFIVIHPTGNYAYIIVNNRQYIMRSDYNWEKKTFTEPYLVVGQDQKSGYTDGVGSNARVNEPQQGVFVKNTDYEGQEDEYDFYFCDKVNHVIRILTPQGRVSTFAGTPGTASYRDGDYAWKHVLPIRQELLTMKKSNVSISETVTTVVSAKLLMKNNK